jgi:hypothetical protein
MPAPAQRVQVLLRPKVLDLVKVLAEEENLTLSKVCSQLIEAGLIAKGIIDPKAPPKLLREVEKEASPSVRAVLGVDVPDNYNMTTTKRTTDLSTEDLELLQKLKALKSVGLL